MMCRPQTDENEITLELEQEFEWVNAWAESTRSAPVTSRTSVAKDRAASSSREMSEPPSEKKPADSETAPAVAPARMAAPGLADAAKLHVPPLELVSALGPNSDATAANDTASPQQPAADQLNPGFIRVDGVEPLDSSADAVDTGTGNGHRRGRWTRLFRLVTRTHGLQRGDRSDADDAARDLFVLDAAPAAAPVGAPAHAAAEGRTAKAPALPHGDTAVPDQLALDIAEIAVVRDKLLAMPPARDASTGVIAAVRTSDAVPILVGIVLALTSMIVFAVAASFVSLR